MINRGVIVSFHGSWQSGIAMIGIKDSKTGVISTIPCDNGTTVRALDSAFGDVITQGHCVDLDVIQGKEIFWMLDDMGLMLGGFTPVTEDSEARIAKYKETRNVST